MARALGLLARREHSRLELSKKLGARGFPRDVVARVIDRLEQSGALSESRFEESYIRARAARGPTNRTISDRVASLGTRSSCANRIASRVQVRKNAVFSVLCASGSEKNVASCRVTTRGRRVNSGNV